LRSLTVVIYMYRRTRTVNKFGTYLIIGAAVAGMASATSLTPNSCAGTCGTGSPNGSVTATPSGNPYQYVTSYLGPTGGGTLPVGAPGSETNGSTLTSSVFSASVGQVLDFSFFYLTSDGTAQFTDYSWAVLVDAATNTQVAQLFAARTNP